MPAEREPRYGQQRVNGPGLTITALLHLLLVLLYVWWPKHDKQAAPPAGEAITYIAPLPGKPKKKELAATAPRKPVKKRQEVVLIERLPDTITLPQEKRIPPPEPEPPKPQVDTSVDISDMIAAKRRARGQATEEQAGEESEKERGMRNALANIAAANGKSRGDDRNDTGGVFSISDQSFSSAQLKFRGWNPSFKRRWLQQVEVQLGTERDIETAIVKKMVELIRKEKSGDFEWDSHRLQRVVKMSARVQDQAELEAFLYLEMFPGYRPPRGK
ncbi:MAG TPA: hypothetical protein VFS95_11495 [Telluria sp.]|nr:hypothetical protein [Telluria sp.]